MKKNNLILILIMIVIIGLLIFFLPDIYNKVQELEANNIELPKNKKNKEEEKKRNNYNGKRYSKKSNISNYEKW